MRVAVLGGAGNFGARIVRALQHEPQMQLVSAGRRLRSVPGAESVPVVALDVTAPDFEARLRELSPHLVIHCVGPFQGQDYRVARAALSIGAHYLDLADGREFVAQFPAQLQSEAQRAGRRAVSGASTLPALSSAVVEVLRVGLRQIERIDVVIAPGQRAVRGASTLQAVFSYLGRPFPVWNHGRWDRTWGWMDLRRVHLDVGSRLAVACDVPDLAVFPTLFDGIQSVHFHAALEFSVQHLVLWSLAGLARIGVPIAAGRWAAWLDRWAGVFDPFAGQKGGMSVTVAGTTEDARTVSRTWQLVAPATDGPEIPCMAALLLARRLTKDPPPPAGASACIGLLTLDDFEPEFNRWQMTTRTAETAL